MLLINDIGLIGDAIGTVPAMIALAQSNGGLFVKMHAEAEWVLNFIPQKYNIKNINLVRSSKYADAIAEIKQFNLVEAFQLSSKEDKYHMTQAHFPFVGLPIPPNPIRPEIDNSFMDLGREWFDQWDYILAPFSRSLPPEQKWPQEKWQSLVDLMPNKKFAMFGNGVHDDRNFISGPNVTPIFNEPFEVVMQIMKYSKALISVVSGPSHLSYALGTKNILLECQGKWGVNPDAYKIHERVCDISVNKVMQLINKEAA